MSGFKDVGLAFSSNIGVTLVAITTQGCLAWYLGPEARGSYAVAVLFGSLLGVFFAVGLDAAVQYYVASKKMTVSDAIAVALFLVVIGGSMAVMLGYFLMGLDIEYFSKADRSSFKLALIYIPVSMLVGFFPRLMVGLRDFIGMGVFSLIQAVFQLIAIFIVLGFFSMGEDGAISAVVTAGIVTVIVEIIYLRKFYSFTFHLPKIQHIKMVVHYGIRHHFARLSNVVNFQMGAIILAFFATREEIGYFSVASNLMGYVVQLPTAIGNALLPRVAGG